MCDPIDGSLPGSAVPGILQARILEWVAIAFSIVWKWKVKVKSLSRVRLLATPWTAAYQAPPSMGFSRQEYWSGLPLPSPSSGWAGGFSCLYMVKLGLQIIVFYVCREHVLGTMNLLSSLGRMWVSCHYCFIVWGYVFCLCYVVVLLSKLAFLSNH